VSLLQLLRLSLVSLLHLLRFGFIRLMFRDLLMLLVLLLLEFLPFLVLLRDQLILLFLIFLVRLRIPRFSSWGAFDGRQVLGMNGNVGARSRSKGRRAVVRREPLPGVVAGSPRPAYGFWELSS